MVYNRVDTYQFIIKTLINWNRIVMEIRDGISTEAKMNSRHPLFSTICVSPQLLIAFSVKTLNQRDCNRIDVSQITHQIVSHSDRLKANIH